jgi:hypothetical protein
VPRFGFERRRARFRSVGGAPGLLAREFRVVSVGGPFGQPAPPLKHFAG